MDAVAASSASLASLACLAAAAAASIDSTTLGVSLSLSFSLSLSLSFWSEREGEYSGAASTLSRSAPAMGLPARLRPSSCSSARAEFSAFASPSTPLPPPSPCRSLNFPSLSRLEGISPSSASFPTVDGDLDGSRSLSSPARRASPSLGSSARLASTFSRFTRWEVGWEEGLRLAAPVLTFFSFTSCIPSLSSLSTRDLFLVIMSSPPPVRGSGSLSASLLFSLLPAFSISSPFFVFFTFLFSLLPSPSSSTLCLSLSIVTSFLFFLLAPDFPAPSTPCLPASPLSVLSLDARSRALTPTARTLSVPAAAAAAASPASCASVPPVNMGSVSNGFRIRVKASATDEEGRKRVSMCAHDARAGGMGRPGEDRQSMMELPSAQVECASLAPQGK